MVYHRETKSILLMKSFFYCLAAITFSFIMLAAGSNDTRSFSLPKNLKKKLAFIPAGKAVAGQDSIAVNSFYISRFEVSNAEYKLFLNYLRSEGKSEILSACLVDSTAWRRSSNYNEPYVQYYFSHPAYSNYPVVNVSYDAALLYANWYAGIVQKELGSGYVVKGALPTGSEWIRAARGNNHSFVYAWGGPYLYNSKNIALCNFMQFGDHCIQTNQKTGEMSIVRKGAPGVTAPMSDNADIMAPVNSYFPNESGIYNMNGNVAEMLSDRGVAAGGSWMSTGYDVRNESTVNYDRPAPDVGFRPVLYITSVQQK